MGEDEIFPLGQELGEMAVVDAGVRGAGEADHPLPDRRTDAPGGGTAAIAVHETSGTAPSIGPADPPKLADGEAHEGGGVGHYQLTALEGIEDDEPLLCPLRQRDHASPVRTGRGRTFSLKP